MARDIANRGVPIAFCSSKTIEEQPVLMDAMGLTFPYRREPFSIYIPIPPVYLKTCQQSKSCGGRLIELGEINSFAGS